MGKKYVWNVYQWKIMPEGLDEIRGSEWYASKDEAGLALQAAMMEFPEGTRGKVNGRFLRMDRPQPASIFLNVLETPYEQAGGVWVNVVRALWGLGEKRGRVKDAGIAFRGFGS